MESLEQLITGRKDVEVTTLARIESLIMTSTGDREKFMVRLIDVTTEEEAQVLIRELYQCQPIPGRDFTPHTVEDQGKAIRFAADLDDFKEQRHMIEKDALDEKLASIRTALDTNTEDVDIEQVIQVGQRLSALMGLSAECMAEAKGRVERARLKAFASLSDKGFPPSVMLKMAEAEISEHTSRYEYADRMNAAITHQIDYFRTVISWRKAEFENSVK